MKANLGITSKNTESVAVALSKILADEFVLSTKTKIAHWNMEGVDFYEKHVLFENQFKLLDQFIDSVAERIRTIGHYTPGSIKGFLKLTHLSEMSREKNDSLGFIKELLSDHESIIIKLREDVHVFSTHYKDAYSTDLITQLMGNHEKMAWFLRAHVKS